MRPHLPAHPTPLLEGTDRKANRIWYRFFQAVADRLQIPVQNDSASAGPYTAAFTAVDGRINKCDPSSGGFTVTLPDVALGRFLIIKNTTGSTNTITITPATGDTVEGQASITITTAYGATHLVADPDGGTWWAI